MDENTTAGLACLSILSEIGYEIMDLLKMIFKRLFTKTGKIKYPAFLIVLLCVHHYFTLCLGIPAILKYRNFKTLHWLSFDLQVVASVAGIVAEYCKLLDLSKQNELHQFILLTFITLILMILT